MIPVYSQPNPGPAIEAAMFKAMKARCLSEGHFRALPKSKPRETASMRRIKRLETITQMIADTPGMTSLEIAEKMKLPAPTVRGYLRMLTEGRKAMTVRVGSFRMEYHIYRASGAATPPAATMANGGPQS